MTRVEELLDKIRDKPGMYIGYPNLTGLSFTLSGYRHALYEDGYKDSTLDGFQDWITDLYGIKSSHNWSNIILFFEHGEESAFYKFYELYDQFRSQGTK